MIISIIRNLRLFCFNYHVGRIVLRSMCVGVSVWLGWSDSAIESKHRNSNTHRTKNNRTNVVIQQNSRKLLMMDILMSETCWAHKKWNKIASDFKLVFYSSTLSLSLSLYIYIYIFLWRCGPTRAMTSSLLRFLDHKQDLPQSVGLLWTSDQCVAETSPDNTQHSQQTDIHSPGGILTKNISRRAAVDLRLRSGGHWDRRMYIVIISSSSIFLNNYFCLEMFRFNTASKKHLFHRISTATVPFNLIVDTDLYHDTHKICPVLHEIQIKGK